MGMQSNFDSDNRLGPQKPLSEINVTPFVDVMLVLLIVFMVSAPLLQQGVQVDLPKTDSMPMAEQKKQFVLVIQRDGTIEINENKIPRSQLREKLRAIFKNIKRKEIFVQADRQVAYGKVAEIMSAIQLAGITRIGLVTEPKK